MKVCYNMEKATNLGEVMTTCHLFPLDNEFAEKFYVDTTKARGVDMVEELVLTFKCAAKFSNNIYEHVLCLGHRGSGKSTVLYQAEKTLKDDYKIFRFTIQECINTEEADLVDILCVMYKHILNTCKDDLDDTDYDLLNDIYNQWNSVITLTQDSTFCSETQVSVGGEIGLPLKIATFFTKLTNALKLGTVEKTRIKKEIKFDLESYISSFNVLANRVSKKYNKPLLVMFEDLDKISDDAAKELFVDNGPWFPQIHVHMLLTTPIFLKYTADFKKLETHYFSGVVRCPMIAITNSSREISEIGYDTMRKIAYARISENLIEKNALDLAIKYSGGVIRDLLRILKDSAKYTMLDGEAIITEKYVYRAILELKLLYIDIFKPNYLPIIQKIHRNPNAIDIDATELTELLCSEIIIEYNGEQWKGVHPCVVARLKELNYLE